VVGKGGTPFPSHLTIEGIRNVVSARAVMNRGLTDLLKEHFTDLILVKRPLVELIRVENLDWVVGFVDAEGSFGVFIGTRSPTCG